MKIAIIFFALGVIQGLIIMDSYRDKQLLKPNRPKRQITTVRSK